jgi:outer membrane protein W
MKITKLSALQVLALLPIASFTTAFADEPANDVRIGLYSVFYHSSADDITGPYVPAGVNLTAENLETLYVGIVHHFPDNFALELALGYPPLSKVKGSGPATVGSTPYDGQVISSARCVPTSASASTTRHSTTATRRRPAMRRAVAPRGFP